MRNQPLFLQAIDKCPDAVDKLHALTAKIASLRQIYTRAPTVDPLDNPDLGPERASNQVAHGRSSGRLIGGLLGAGVGAGLGHDFGHGMIGQPLASIGEHLSSGIGHLEGHGGGDTEPFFQQNIHHIGDDIRAAGGIGGAPEGALVGALAGRSVGGAIGAGLGRVSQNFASPESQAAEKIKKMDPATGLAHIRMLEQSGHASPSVIQAMKDTYETRRRGLGTQIQSGVPVPPGTTVQSMNSRPTAAPF